MLESALDYGLFESQFWDMTMAEYLNFMQSQRRIEKRRIQERALLDWHLADLIAKSMSRIYSSSATMPEFHEYYAALFDEEEKKTAQEQRQEKKDELSALRFKQFADSYNKRFKENKEVQKD